jgi:TRAP-type C4-dicarboxylate transport system permease small subunit
MRAAPAPSSGRNHLMDWNPYLVIPIGVVLLALVIVMIMVRAIGAGP